MRILTPILVVVALVVGFIIGRNYQGGSTQVATGPAAAAPPAGSAGAPGAKLTVPPGQPVVGFLDQADGKSVIPAAGGAEVKLSGWAGCADPASPVSKVEILVDNRMVTAATQQVPRPDVAAAYARPDFAMSGWKAAVPTQGIPAGSHPITARVTCAKGEAGSLPAFQLAVTR